MSRKLPSVHRDQSIKGDTCRRVAIYVREEDSGQAIALRRFAGSQPGVWRVVKVYTGRHTSIARDGARMVRDARDGVFDTLLVHSLDRLSRNLGSLSQLLGELADANVAVRSASEPMFDTATPVGRLRVSMLGVSAEMEASMRRRMSAGRREATARGSHDG